MRTLGDPSAGSHLTDNVPANVESAVDSPFDTDEPEVQNLDLDVDLDMFSAEDGRSRPEAPPAPAHAVAEQRSNLKMVPPKAERPTPPPEVTEEIPPSLTETASNHLRTLTVAGSPAQRIAIAVVALTTIVGALWGAATLQQSPAPVAPPSQSSNPAPADRPAVSQPSAASAAPINQAPPSSSTVATSSPAPVPPVSPPAAAAATAVSIAPSISRPAPPPAPVASGAAGVVAVGYLKVESPIALDIANGGSLIGTTRSDRTLLAAGDYDLVFTNDQIGYRETRRVTIQPGRLRQLDIRIPDGMVSVNARPWANVTIDGRPVGETPLGNLTVAAGVHQVVFTHPQFGQRRVEAVVRVGQHVRLNVNLNGDQE